MFKMCKVSFLLVAGILICSSIIDIKYRKLPMMLLAGTSGIVAVYRIRSFNEGITSWVLGAVIGAVFLLISKITKESLGYADSWIILILGVYLGCYKLIGVLIIAFFLSGIFSIFYFVAKKINKKQSFPFVPFLAAAYIGVILI